MRRYGQIYTLNKVTVNSVTFAAILYFIGELKRMILMSSKQFFLMLHTISSLSLHKDV
jgi:hypothetical protein